MKSNYLNLLKLIMNKQPITSNTLANELNVSVRSIRNYIKEINKEYENTIQSSNSGYYLDKLKAKKIIENSMFIIPQTSSERVSYIINKCIDINANPINMYDLCDELYISESTLKLELKKVKKKISNFDLSLDISGEFLEINGSEKNKRKLISSILYDESTINFVNIDTLKKYFVNIDIDYIKKIVIDTFDKYHYFINDYSLINLILHISISIDRIQNKNVMSIDSYFSPSITTLKEYSIAKELITKLEEKNNITFSESEIQEMTLLISSRTTSCDYRSVNYKNLEQFVGTDVFNLVIELINNINTLYYINLNDSDFLTRFALHIKNLLVRSKNNYFCKNPLTESIIKSYPLLYDISVSLAFIIKERTNIEINSDEIAYITLHLANSIEVQKVLENKINAILYSPNYYDMNLKLTNKINKYFGKDVIITDIVTCEENLNTSNNCNLIISTLPISKIIITPVVQVTLLLSDKEQHVLQNKITEIKNNKAKNEFKTMLTELIKPELFETNKNFYDKYNCIDYMTQKLYKLNYVKPSYRTEILEREKMSSTAFDYFAMPHTMKMDANKTGISVLITNNSILWDQKSVNLILMLCFNINERSIFNKIFESIITILSDTKNRDVILASKTYDEFIDNMVKCL